MPSIDLWISGEPHAQGRPRFTTVCGHVQAYDPKESRDYKTLIGVLAREAMMGRPLFDGPMKVFVGVYRRPPASWSKRKQDKAIGTPIVTKPDLDNYIKLLDALNGVVFVDDSRIAVIEAQKAYDIQAGLRIKISTIGDKADEDKESALIQQDMQNMLDYGEGGPDGDEF